MPEIPTGLSATPDDAPGDVIVARAALADDCGRLDAEARALIEEGHDLEGLVIVTAPGQPARVAPRWAVPAAASAARMQSFVAERQP